MISGCARDLSSDFCPSILLLITKQLPFSGFLTMAGYEPASHPWGTIAWRKIAASSSSLSGSSLDAATAHHLRVQEGRQREREREKERKKERERQRGRETERG